MSDVLNKLLIKANSKKSVYIHNSSNFDLIFILKHIANFPGVRLEPTIRDGRFLNLKIKYGSKKEFFINFKDSYLLLPASLNNSAKQFKVESPKGMFPHNFVNSERLNYIGLVPSLDFFTDISKSDYLSYSQTFINKNWVLKKEAIKYCELDCVSLYQVLGLFGKFIYDRFQLNITDVFTLPSLAFKIFRAHFLPTTVNVPILTGRIYDAINQAYYGGHVDMYIPSNLKDKIIYQYDVNGLYPYVMREFFYPEDIVAHFVGDITTMREYRSLFTIYTSFLKVKVKAPTNLPNPILPYKNNGKIVYGGGQWTGWYYIQELINAKKFGYTFEYLEGYLFKQSNLFDNYVNNLGLIKETSPSSSPMYTVSKLLFNSLYGRFGMNPKTLSHVVVDSNDISDVVHKIGLDNLIDQVELGNKIILSY